MFYLRVHQIMSHTGRIPDKTIYASYDTKEVRDRELQNVPKKSHQGYPIYTSAVEKSEIPEDAEVFHFPY